MDSVTKLLSDLVAFPVLGGQSNLTILKYIENYLHQFGVVTHRVPNEDGSKASLFARIGPAVDGGIILSGHMDVVPVEGQDWHTAPFALTERDGLLYARGACDMKGFLACVLAVVPQMLEATLQKPIYLAFSYDEEIGCVAAPALAAALLAHYAEQPRYAIIGEPSMMQPIVGQKGICVFKTTVFGSAGHSSRIRQEVSAIHEAARLVIWLEDKMNALYDAGHIDHRFTPPHTSLHVGMFHGGIAPNVIADQCTFYWDVRNIPQDKIEDVHTEFLDFTRQREAILQHRFAGTRIVTDVDHPLVPALDTPENLSVVPLIRQLSQRDDLGTVAYAAEAGQFALAGLESVICGPGSIAQAHRANEFISKEQLEQGKDFIERVVRWAINPIIQDFK